MASIHHSVLRNIRKVGRFFLLRPAPAEKGAELKIPAFGRGLYLLFRFICFAEQGLSLEHTGGL